MSRKRHLDPPIGQSENLFILPDGFFAGLLSVDPPDRMCEDTKRSGTADTARSRPPGDTPDDS